MIDEMSLQVEKYHAEILNDLVTNITANQWRVRMSCCLALSDLLRYIHLKKLKLYFNVW